MSVYLSSLVRASCMNMHIFIPSYERRTDTFRCVKTAKTKQPVRGTWGLDIARTALRSDPEQNVSAAPRTTRPLPSVQFSSWLTFSSRSTIMLPGRRNKT